MNNSPPAYICKTAITEQISPRKNAPLSKYSIILQKERHNASVLLSLSLAIMCIIKTYGGGYDDPSQPFAIPVVNSLEDANQANLEALSFYNQYKTMIDPFFPFYANQEIKDYFYFTGTVEDISFVPDSAVDYPDSLYTISVQIDSSFSDSYAVQSTNRKTDFYKAFINIPILKDERFIERNFFKRGTRVSGMCTKYDNMPSCIQTLHLFDDFCERDNKQYYYPLSIKRRSDMHIVCWGDSLTAPADGWTNTLEILSGVPVHNAGVGGEKATTIMARQGGDVITINNIIIPAEQTPITIANRAFDKGLTTEEGKIVTPLLRKDSGHFNPVLIGDIEGNLSWTGKDHEDSNGSWVFTRNEPGEKVTINRPTAIRTAWDRRFNGQDVIMIIFMGANGGYQTIDELVNMHRKMIDHFQGKEYLILGFSHGSNNPKTKSYETAMKKEFGRRFISLREYLSTPIYDKEGNLISCYGLDDQGLLPKDKEYDGITYKTLDEIKEGIVPHQLLIDSIHYTSGTHHVIGSLIYKKMKELNMLPPDTGF